MKQSEPFTAMAERIERNPEFGGAVVIVPPAGEEPLEWLIVDTKSDILRFWVKLKTDIDAIIQRLDERARMQSGFGQMR
jgi:hypothetical protein